MTAPPQSVPRPAVDIWNEMVAASIDHDETRFAVAREHYFRWLEARGYHVPHGSTRPDEAIR